MISESASQIPELSVVIVVVSDVMHLEGCLTALSQQVAAPVMEIIVPYDSCKDDIQSLKSRFPEVQFYWVSDIQSSYGGSRYSHEYLDKMRAIGIGLVHGAVVALLEDHDRPDKYWSMHVMEAHKEPHAAIGGAIENEVNRPLNWAIYFCDFGRYQRPFKAGPSNYLSDVNISYKRQALNNIKETWQDFYHEPFVNGALMAQGEQLWLSPEIVVFQHRMNLRLAAALRERYLWGRYYASFRVIKFTLNKRLLYIASFPALPFLLVARKACNVLIKKRNINEFLRAFPFTFMLTVVWSFGEFMGYLTARSS